MSFESIDPKTAAAKLAGEKFRAREAEKVLGCHVSTVELHGLVERGELACSGHCEHTWKGKLPEANPDEYLVTDADGEPVPMTGAQHAQWRAANRDLQQSIDGLYHRHPDGTPITIDMAPCKFWVVNEAKFATWVAAKLEQREREHNPIVRHRILADQARMGAEHARLAAASLPDDHPRHAELAETAREATARAENHEKELAALKSS